MVVDGGAGGDIGQEGGGVATADEPPGRKELLTFVADLRALVELALERPALWRPYNRLLRRAWPLVSARFQEVYDGVARAPEDELRPHGLTGPELALKLEVFYEARDSYGAFVNRVDGRLRTRLFGNPIPRVLPLAYTEEDLESSDETLRRWAGAIGSGVQRGAKKLAQGKAKAALKIGDAILGSIGLAVPPVAIAAGAAGEFKGMMEAIAGG